MISPDTRHAVNIQQAMARAGVSRRTIYTWLKAGKLEYVRTAGGRIRIFEDSLWRPIETVTGTLDR